MTTSNAFKYTITLLLGIFLLSLLQCYKKENGEEVKVTEDTSIVLNTFTLEKNNNPQLEADVAFEIKGNTIVGSLNLYDFKALPTFTTNAKSVEINGQIQTSGVSKVDLRQSIVYTLISEKGTKKQFTVNINWDDKLPQIDIVTKGSVPIVSNQTYIQADISINGRKIYSDYTGTVQIRGRGNSTWTFPKKPYRFKLDSKTSLLGLAPEKDWVLLANYLDGTHMLNAVSLKIGRLLNMPFTNNIIPVEVTLNGQYQGTYMFTEQVEVKKNRVNVGDDGILLDLDTNFDEIGRFKSAAYQLPVMIKYPEVSTPEEIVPIQTQFEQLESLVASSSFPNNNYLDYMDGESLANYLIVYLLTDNEEINHPKSTYIHKTKTGKFNMGPIWDFDWAFSFEKSSVYFSNPNKPLFWSPPSVGTKFFSKLLSDPKIKALVKQRWADFRANKFNELLTFVDDYSFIIEGARNRDYQKWKRGSINFKNDVVAIKTWFQDRAKYMDNYIGGL